MEMVTAHARTGASLPVRAYFQALMDVKQARGVACSMQHLGARCVALHTPVAHCGLDNGFNLLETALHPVAGGPGGLGRLAEGAFLELADSLLALQADEGCVLNASQHPDCPRDDRWYARVCVPRPIYRELRDHRGWHHWVGIDAKAQNGANTSIPVDQAILALNVAVALAPVSVALFANSPLESGVHAGLKEQRLTVWPRMFGPARFAGDLKLCTRPDRPFIDLADFFHWMFGPGTVTRGLPSTPGMDYKAAVTVLPEGDPCLRHLLQAGRWPARRLGDGQAAMLELTAGHFEYSQIGQFLDARLRYRWARTPSLSALLQAWSQAGGLEALFEACGAQMYIEARAPGAGFADACLLAEGGAAVARSLVMAPSALQLGLLRRLPDAWRLVQDWGWSTLGELRPVAMRHGLEDSRVRALCAQVLDVARAGLESPDRAWLDYPDFVLRSGRTGADRLLQSWHAAGTKGAQRLAALLPRHAALHPHQYGGLTPDQGLGPSFT